MSIMVPDPLTRNDRREHGICIDVSVFTSYEPYAFICTYYFLLHNNMKWMKKKKIEEIWHVNYIAWRNQKKVIWCLPYHMCVSVCVCLCVCSIIIMMMVMIVLLLLLLFNIYTICCMRACVFLQSNALSLPVDFGRRLLVGYTFLAHLTSNDTNMQLMSPWWTSNPLWHIIFTRLFSSACMMNDCWNAQGNTTEVNIKMKSGVCVSSGWRRVNINVVLLVVPPPRANVVIFWHHMSIRWCLLCSVVVRCVSIRRRSVALWDRWKELSYTIWKRVTQKSSSFEFAYETSICRLPHRCGSFLRWSQHTSTETIRV